MTEQWSVHRRELKERDYTISNDCHRTNHSRLSKILAKNPKPPSMGSLPILVKTENQESIRVGISPPNVSITN